MKRKNKETLLNYKEQILDHMQIIENNMNSIYNLLEVIHLRFDLDYSVDNGE